MTTSRPGVYSTNFEPARWPIPEGGSGVSMRAFFACNRRLVAAAAAAGSHRDGQIEPDVADLLLDKLSTI